MEASKLELLKKFSHSRSSGPVSLFNGSKVDHVVWVGDEGVAVVIGDGVHYMVCSDY